VTFVTVRINRTRNRRGEGPRLRAEIVDAATQLLVEKGPEAVTLRAIARRAGITAPSIYAHFEGRNAVLEAVVATTFQMLADCLRRAVEGHTDPVARLRAVCHAYVAFGREHPQDYAVLFTQKSRLLGDLTELTVDSMHGAEAFAFLLDGIRDCVASGASRSTRPQEDAAALWVAVHGYVVLHAAIPNFPWPPDTELLDTFIDRLALLT
jgi:AcrR family transcriptional regulator